MVTAPAVTVLGVSTVARRRSASSAQRRTSMNPFLMSTPDHPHGSQGDSRATRARVAALLAGPSSPANAADTDHTYNYNRLSTGALALG